jgi:hypothetical protein
MVRSEDFSNVAFFFRGQACGWSVVIGLILSRQHIQVSGIPVDRRGQGRLVGYEDRQGP